MVYRYLKNIILTVAMNVTRVMNAFHIKFSLHTKTIKVNKVVPLLNIIIIYIY